MRSLRRPLAKKNFISVLIGGYVHVSAGLRQLALEVHVLVKQLDSLITGAAVAEPRDRDLVAGADDGLNAESEDYRSLDKVRSRVKNPNIAFFIATRPNLVRIRIEVIGFCS